MDISRPEKPEPSQLGDNRVTFRTKGIIGILQSFNSYPSENWRDLKMLQIATVLPVH
jgi:hypothetical protein